MEHTTHRSDSSLTLALRWAAFALVAGLASACGDDHAPARESAALVPPVLEPATAEPEPVHLGTIAPPTPEPSPSLETAEAVEAPARPEPSVDGLDARRVALARSIEGREPVDPHDRFLALDAPLYAHFELTNREGTEDRHPQVVFIGPDGQERGLIELSVPAGAARWRTWAFSRNVRMPGEWRVELRDEDGRVLTEQEFTLEAE